MMATIATAPKITQDGSPPCFFFWGIALRGDISVPLARDFVQTTGCVMLALCGKKREMSNKREWTRLCAAHSLGGAMLNQRPGCVV